MSFEATAWAYRQDLPVGRKFLLVALANYADEDHTCYPGQAKLAAMTGQGERTVRRLLALLEADGYIVREHRQYADGHRNSDRYTLAVGRDITPRQGVDDGAGEPTGQPANLAAWPTGQPANGDSSNRPLVAANTKKEPKKELIHARENFDRFWAIYPRHTAKRAAELSFARAVKRAPVDRILDGAIRLRDEPGRDPRYTPHPSTWLNQDRWDDEPTSPPVRESFAVGSYHPARGGFGAWEE